MTRLRSVCDERDRRGDQQRQRADDRADVGGRRRLLEQRPHARDQVDAGGDHRRRVDQGGDRRRALHRVREPRVQRHLGGLRERADEQQDAARRRGRRRCGAKPRAPARSRRGSPACPCSEDEERPEHQADVADDVDDERLDARARRGLAPVPERDQQVGRRADERPADDQQQEVARHDQQQHREDEEVQVREEPRVAAVATHVGDRVEVDQRRDAGDHQHHEDATAGRSRIESLASTPDACSRSPRATRRPGAGPRRGSCSAMSVTTAQTNDGADRGGADAARRRAPRRRAEAAAR